LDSDVVVTKPTGWVTKKLELFAFLLENKSIISFCIHSSNIANQVCDFKPSMEPGLFWKGNIFKLGQDLITTNHWLGDRRKMLWKIDDLT